MNCQAQETRDREGPEVNMPVDDVHEIKDQGNGEEDD
jgi:hypothetical protein